MSSRKSVLIINRTPPYGSCNARESLDIALTCSIFEMQVSILFLDDGIFQLLSGQQPEQIGYKNLQSLMASLPMYDIENIYVGKGALERHGLILEDLSVKATIADDTDITALINSHDTVLTF